MKAENAPQAADESPQEPTSTRAGKRRRQCKRPMLRAWIWGVLSVQFIATALFGISNYVMIMRNTNVTQQVPEEARPKLYWTATLYSLQILLGYLVIALVMATISYLLLISWRSLRGRKVTTRASVAWAIGMLLLLVGYKFADYAVDSPFVLMNMFKSEGGIASLGWVVDIIPVWAPFVARAVFAALALTVVVLAAIRAIERMPRRRRVYIVSAVAVLPVLGMGLGLTAAIERRPAEPKPGDRLNVLILASDGLRPDHLGIYGYELPTSRNIDEIGADAVRFDACYVPVGRTLPSWTSMLTSTYPHTHGQRVTWPRESNIKLPMPTLVDELRKAGYQTAVLSDWAGGDFAKVQYGFDDVKVSPDAWNLYTFMSQGMLQGHPFLVAFADNPLGRLVFPHMVGMPVNPCPEALTDLTIDRLRDYAHDSRPFFMVTFYSETHIPYATRYPYYRKFSPPKYQGPHKVAMYVPDYVNMGKGKLDLDFYDPPQLRALYDAAILSFDDEVGRIMRHLRELNLHENTIVIVTSDHGENLFETPTSWGHGSFFFGGNHDVHIPLIISDPALRGQGPRVVNELASSLDIMPTLLERLGLEVPETCRGRSLLPAVEGRGEVGERQIFFESGVWIGGEPDLEGEYLKYPSMLDTLEVSNAQTGQLGIGSQYFDQIMTAKHRMLRTNKWKLIYMPTVRGAEYQLFDIENDPHSARNVKDEYPEVYEQLKDDLWKWMLEDTDRVRRGENIVRPGQKIRQYVPED